MCVGAVLLGGGGGVFIRACVQRRKTLFCTMAYIFLSVMSAG